VISRAALKAMSRGANRKDIVTLDPDMLDLDDLHVAPEPPSAAGGDPPDAAAPPPVLREVVEASQREAIRAALARHRDNWACAARDLQVDASNLHKLARRLGLKQGPANITKA